MKETKQTEQKAPIGKDWTLDEEINFSITFIDNDGNPEAVKWFFNILETENEKQMRQKHFALPDDQQAAARHSYNAEIISRLASKAPEGLPGFEQFLSDANNQLQPALQNWLSRPFPKIVRLCTNTLEYYRTINQPVEFYAGLK